MEDVETFNMEAMCAVSSLPPEIWRFIIDLLPRRDHRTCLFLSKVHHDIAFSNMFSHVTVTFGLWRWRGIPADQFNIQPNDEDDDYRRMVRRNGLTWDILRAISGRPDFAKVVREFTVRAHAWEGGEHFLEKRPLQGCLIQALKVLPNLRAFHWYGQRPAPSSEIFEALATGSSTTLTELHMPMLQRMAPALPPVDSFSSLRSISLVFPDATVGADFNALACDDAITLLLDTKAPTITCLSISGDMIWKCQSLNSFVALRELELIFTEVFDGLSDILVHCVAITSLTLLPAGWASLGQLSTALEAHSDTLPGLIAFKYIAHIHLSRRTTVEEVLVLCKFLENKQRLRCLDVVIEAPEQAEQPLLELLPKLPALEVLGFDFVAGDWPVPDDILFFERVIPARVSALRLDLFADFDMDVPELPASYREAWLKLLRSRASLRYLHIFECAAVPEPPSEDLGLSFHPLSVEELPSSLELFGYGLYLRPIVRESADEANSNISPPRPVLGPCWPMEKVAFRTAEDFGCADWEWLLRWHDFNGLDSLEPGVLKNGV